MDSWGNALLVSAEELAAMGSVVVLDVRWTVHDRHNGRERYRAGHIPGAVYVDLETELSGPPSDAEGRHPLPDITTLEETARRWGINDGDAVVVYDDTSNLAAARAWWLLRWGGFPDVRLLDGGLDAWRAAGQPLATGDETRPPGNVHLTAGNLPTVDVDEAARMGSLRRAVLIDSRAPERFRGEGEPLDPRAGHIPGAVNAPTVENLTADGRFLPPAELRKRFIDLGIDGDTSVAVYCGSGIYAAHEIVALRLAGFGAALYPGSWSQWSRDPARPVATGD